MPLDDCIPSAWFTASHCIVKVDNGHILGYDLIQHFSKFVDCLQGFHGEKFSLES
jgi:hypothetical protein